MRPGAIHVVTKGSNVWLDDEAGEYLRLPLTERGRRNAEWSDERAGALQDAVWHAMTSWQVAPFPTHRVQAGVCALRYCSMCPGLIITYPPDGEHAWFPGAQVVSR